MIVLGIRCSNTDYTCSILEGDADIPEVKETQHIAFPKGYGEAEALRWFYREMQSLFTSWRIDAVGIKRAETNVKRSNSLELRIQHEGIATLAAAEHGCTAVYRKVNSTIAKDLGLKGKGKYLQTKLDTSPIPNFDNYSKKKQEAILTAWSCMD
ncbi:MAG: hypothetical protein ISS59_01215 [Desulfobacteraceae bacterium]|nr:hypothetical protein [Desulfobacteraceae bacterium]